MSIEPRHQQSACNNIPIGGITIMSSLKLSLIRSEVYNKYFLKTILSMVHKRIIMKRKDNKNIYQTNDWKNLKSNNNTLILRNSGTPVWSIGESMFGVRSFKWSLRKINFRDPQVHLWRPARERSGRFPLKFQFKTESLTNL